MQICFYPLMPGNHLKVRNTLKNVVCLGVYEHKGLFKHVWPFSEHQALKILLAFRFPFQDEERKLT